MILVTGGTGLVGGHMLYRLRESGLRNPEGQGGKPIRAIYRTEQSLEKTRQIFASYPEPHLEFLDQIQWIKADLLDIPSLTKAFEGVTEIYHCAAVVDAAISFKQLKQINVEGTSNMVNLAITHQIEKFCHVSSIATMEQKVGEQTIDEKAGFSIESLHSDYAISKYGAELEVWRASQEGLQVIIVNPGVIIGETDYTTGSGKIISKCAKGMRFYTSGGSGFVDVRDVVNAMFLLMQSDISQQRFILVAENISFKSLITSVNKKFGHRPPRTKIPDWILWMLAYIDVVYHLFSNKHFLSKANAHTLTSRDVYSSVWIRQALHKFQFRPVDETIERVVKHFQNQNLSN